MTAQQKTVGIVQARIGSSRLPGKVMADFAGAPMLQRLLERVMRSRQLSSLFVSTGTAAANDPIRELCRSLNVPCRSGEEEDVFARFESIIQETGADIAVRLTGDNPLVDGKLVDAAVDAFLAAGSQARYANTLGETGFPVGLTLEVFSTAALFALGRRDDDKVREHVTWALRQEAEQDGTLISIRSPAEPVTSPVTVDTAEDLARVRPIFETLYAADPAFDYRAVLDLLHSHDSGPPLQKNQTRLSRA